MANQIKQGWTNVGRAALALLVVLGSVPIVFGDVDVSGMTWTTFSDDTDGAVSLDEANSVEGLLSIRLKTGDPITGTIVFKSSGVAAEAEDIIAGFFNFNGTEGEVLPLLGGGVFSLKVETTHFVVNEFQEDGELFNNTSNQFSSTNSPPSSQTALDERELTGTGTFEPIVTVTLAFSGAQFTTPSTPVDLDLVTFIFGPPQ